MNNSSYTIDLFVAGKNNQLNMVGLCNRGENCGCEENVTHVDHSAKIAFLASCLPSCMRAQPDGKRRPAHWLLAFHDELQDGISDSDLIPVIQDPHINGFAVDKGSIGALQILKNESAIFPLDRDMLPGNR